MLRIQGGKHGTQQNISVWPYGHRKIMVDKDFWGGWIPLAKICKCKLFVNYFCASGKISTFLMSLPPQLK